MTMFTRDVRASYFRDGFDICNGKQRVRYSCVGIDCHEVVYKEDRIKHFMDRHFIYKTPEHHIKEWNLSWIG